MAWFINRLTNFHNLLNSQWEGNPLPAACLASDITRLERTDIKSITKLPEVSSVRS
jgi:hypothetical protein